MKIPWTLFVNYFDILNFILKNNNKISAEIFMETTELIFILGLINVTRLERLLEWTIDRRQSLKFNHLSGKWIINPVINFVINSIRIIPGNFAARI